MFTLIVTAAALIVLCGVSWHDQTAQARQKGPGVEPKTEADD